jgi:hypothetical protein
MTATPTPATIPANVLIGFSLLPCFAIPTMGQPLGPRGSGRTITGWLSAPIGVALEDACALSLENIETAVRA